MQTQEQRHETVGIFCFETGMKVLQGRSTYKVETQQGSKDGRYIYTHKCSKTF